MESPVHVIPQVYVHEGIPLQLVVGIGEEVQHQFYQAEQCDQPPGFNPG